MKRAVFGFMAVGLWAVPAAGFAHGIGGRQDLPVPVEFFVVGAGVVLVVSFVALAVLWPEPRLQGELSGKVLHWPWLRPAGAVLGALGLVGLVLVVVAGLIGPDTSSGNPASVLVFVVFWLVVPFASALVGDLYPALDPWKQVRGLFGLEDGNRPVRSVYPALLGFLAFTWLELVSAWQAPFHLAVAALVYTVALLAWGFAGWRSQDADAFAVYNRLLGAISPIGRDAEGRIVRYGWLRQLPHLPDQAGLVAFVVAMLGTVTYDGASATDWWSQAIELPLSRFFFDLGFSSTVSSLTAQTIAFLGVSGVLGGAYLVASYAAARLGGAGSAVVVARRFVHTLVPIALAYAFAHYFTLILFEGQLLLSTMSDPFGLGWDLFGTVDRAINYSLITGSATWIWYVQVAAIVIGHVAGVVLAHDRALADFEGIKAIHSQYAMLVLMVALTGLGLLILSAG